MAHHRLRTRLLQIDALSSAIVLGFLVSQLRSAAAEARGRASAGASPTQPGAEPPGITGITKGPADLAAPAESAPGEILRYGLGFAFQVAPRQAGIFCGLRVEGMPVYDFAGGTDLILFDDLSDVNAHHAVPLSRTEKLVDPETGQARIVLRFPMIGGFVPLGARRVDGSPHPHAGTGFGVCQAISFPVNEAGYFSWRSERRHRLEVRQFEYDGNEFRVSADNSLADADHPSIAASAWRIQAPGIAMAIADGDDLLQGILAVSEAGAACGVLRWVRSGGTWAPLAFVPVTGLGERWSEPSVVRDTQGALLFCARGQGDAANLLRVWRSADGGQTWAKTLEVPEGRAEAPVSISRAADGTPFIGANPIDDWRETLCVWPLGPKRSGLGEAIVVRAAREEFGPPPGGGKWMVDHPNAVPLQLADGGWHAVLVYRVLQQSEHKGDDPAPQTGCYLEEVLSAGEPIPIWSFE